MIICKYDLSELFDRASEVLVAKQSTQSSLDVDNPEPIVTNTNWKVFVKTKNYSTNTIQITLQDLEGGEVENLDLGKLSFEYDCASNEISITDTIAATEVVGEIKNVYAFTFVGSLSPAAFIMTNLGGSNGNCF